MDKYYSYTDFLRAVGQSQNENGAEKLLNDIYLDLFLNRLQRTFREEQIMELIDISLDQRDEELFYQLTEELNHLQSIST